MARQDSDKMMIRLPDGMRDAIKIAAVKNRRSMNAEVLLCLEQAFPVQSQATEEDDAATATSAT